MGLTSAATVFAVASIGMASGAGLYLEAVLATLITLFALAFVGYVESKAGWKHITMLYEMRGTDRKAMYIAALSVLDRMGIRLDVLKHDSVEGFERMTFSVPASRSRHAELIRELRSSGKNEEVVVFRDPEEE
jgi:putative Mg2+ transporter-C (MgtC) family protein